MAMISRFSDEKKASVLAELAQASVTVTAKKHGISPATIHTWKKAAGMGSGKKRRASKKRRAKRDAEANGAAINGKAEANGKAPHEPAPSAEVPHLELKGLQSWLRWTVRDELRKMLGHLGDKP